MAANRRLGLPVRCEVTDGRLAQRIEPSAWGALDRHCEVVGGRVHDDLAQTGNRVGPSPIRRSGEDIGLRGDVVESYLAHVRRELVGKTRPDGCPRRLPADDEAFELAGDP